MGQRLVQVEGMLYRRDRDRAGFELSVPSFELHPGEAVAVVGASGSGKSTLLDILAMLREPTSATDFRLMGIDIAELWRRKDLDARTRLRARSIGYILQTGGLLPFLCVRENVLLPQRLRAKEDHALADELLERLGIAHLAQRMPAQISLGERQRVAVARALAHRPRLVLADEPTASLDKGNAEIVFSLLLAVFRGLDAGLVIATHDAALVSKFGLAFAELGRSESGSAIGPIARSTP
jgi:putative ABC transport system ATP-binding protein